MPKLTLFWQERGTKSLHGSLKGAMVQKAGWLAWLRVSPLLEAHSKLQGKMYTYCLHCSWNVDVCILHDCWSTSASKQINSSAPFILSLWGYHLFTCLEHRKRDTETSCTTHTVAISICQVFSISAQSVRRAQRKWPGWGSWYLWLCCSLGSQNPAYSSFSHTPWRNQQQRDVWGMQEEKQNSHALESVRSTIKTSPR